MYLYRCNECDWEEYIDEHKHDFCLKCGHVNISRNISSEQTAVGEIESKSRQGGMKTDKLSAIKERFNEDEIERDDMEWLIEQVVKGMTENAAIMRSLHECITRMQKIKFICQRAKWHYIEEKDIDDILKLLEGKV